MDDIRQSEEIKKEGFWLDNETENKKLIKEVKRLEEQILYLEQSFFDDLDRPYRSAAHKALEELIGLQSVYGFLLEMKHLCEQGSYMMEHALLSLLEDKEINSLTFFKWRERLCDTISKLVHVHDMDYQTEYINECIDCFMKYVDILTDDGSGYRTGVDNCMAAFDDVEEYQMTAAQSEKEDER